MRQFAAHDIDGIQVRNGFTATDSRGSLTRMWPLSPTPVDQNHVAQVLISRNTMAYTLRGMHFQRGVHAEQKVVSVTRGKVLDVVVDLRPDSLTYLGWAGIELSEDETTAFCIPRGVAHGFLTLVAHTEVSYIIDQPYVPAASSGCRWDDSLIGVDWPTEPHIVSEQDRSWPDLEYGFSALAE